jgi:hypothetical protein
MDDCHLSNITKQKKKQKTKKKKKFKENSNNKKFKHWVPVGNSVF